MATEDLWATALRLHQGGANRDAQKIYQKIVQDEPDNARALYLLGQIAETEDQVDTAIKHYSEASTLAPTWFEPSRELIRIFIAAQRFADADRKMASIAPQHHVDARFHELAAEILAKIGDHRASLKAFESAVQCTNVSGQSFLNLAKCARQLGDTDRALLAYEKATGYIESRNSALINAAGIHYLRRAYHTARRLYELVPITERGNGNWVFTYVEALRELGLTEQWIATATALTSDQSNSATGLRLRTEIAQFLGNLDDAHQLQMKGVKASAGDEVDAREEFAHLRLHFDQSSAAHKEYYASVDSAWTQAKTKLRSPNTINNREHDRIASKALRVGYMSADFREHVLGRMAAVMVESRDKSSHQAIIYSLGSQEDSRTAAFAKSADLFVRCAAADDEAIAARIAADKIDVLVDLTGPTAGGRIGVLALKPAPITITHVGAAGPIGLSTINYKLTDSVCDLPENQEYLIETLLPMAGCCYPIPKYPLPTSGVSKLELQLEGRVTIGAFFSYMKLSARCVKLWKRVMDVIPDSVLLFSPLDAKFEDAYRNIMRVAEIPDNRFHFLIASPTEAERLARYRVVDYVLDSMPYGGVNGTLEALYMGVPVVTLTGTHHSERTSTSMLTHLGVTDTIAQTPEEYIAHAKRLATDPAWRDDISTRIRARWPKFADPVDYARRWEALLRKVAR